MNKKLVMALVLVIITVMCAISFTACNGNIVYDAGEYGELEYSGGQYQVKTNEGYKFIGWDTSGKQGIKKLYKAQYERIEYYLTEEKDVYECEQDKFVLFVINYNITNMQTMETVDTGIVRLPKYKASDPNMNISWSGDGAVGVAIEPKEFDFILTLTAEDYEYNIKQDFELHLVRNRIPAEQIEISGINPYGEKCVIQIFNGNLLTGVMYLKVDTVLPENTSFRKVGYNILEIIRGNNNINKDDISEYAYVKNGNLCLTEKAQVGDIIRVQAYNERDPEVKSNILTIFVTED